VHVRHDKVYFGQLKLYRPGNPGVVLLYIMAYTGRLHPKGVPFSTARYMEG